MKLQRSFLVGLVSIILLVSVFSAGLVFSVGTTENEMDTSILVHTRGRSADRLRRSSDYDVLQEYESFSLVETTDKGLDMLEDNAYVFERLENREQVVLHSHTFESSEGVPEISSDLSIDSNREGTLHYIVQFIGPIHPEWVDRLESAGVTPHQHRHRFNLIVEMDLETKREVENFDFVNWVGIYQPAYRFDHTLLEDPGTLDLYVYTFGTADTDRIARRISSFGRVYHVKEGRIITRVETESIKRIANIPGVNHIDRGFFEYELFNDDATWVTQTGVENNRRVTEEGVVGTGEIVTVMDSELYVDHEAFADPGGNPIGNNHRKVLDMYSPEGARGDLGEGVYHGTHVTGTVLGDAPEYDEYDKHDGHAMGARVIFQDIGTAAGGLSVPPEMYDSSFGASYDAGSRAHTNSWGGRGGYDGMAVETDEFIWDHQDYNVLWAAGNEGPDSGTISGQAQAKNAFTVGGVVNAPRHDDMAEFSSRGWAVDGRIKPTILGVAQGVTSADQSADGYAGMSGTSMSTPALAGQVAQVRQYYEDGYYPLGYAGSSEGFNPSSALVKATLINSAVEVSGDGAYNHGNRFPNQDQGFGLSTLDRALYFEWDERTVEVFDSWNEGVELSTGDSWSMEFEVVDDSMPLEATLVWNDRAGDSSGSAIVNDLDLELHTPDSTRYVGNAYTGYDPGYSEPDPSSNDWDGGRNAEFDGLNVEENILLKPDHNGVDTGTYELVVSAHNVPQGSQPFAVVVSGGLDPVMPEGTPPEITLTNPTGGETWDEGTDVDLSWDSVEGDDSIESIDLRYSIDDGGSWDDIVMGLPVTETEYTWTIPNHDSSECLIRARVMDSVGRFAYDNSDHFQIVGTAPSSPSGLDVFHGGGPTIVTYDDFEDGHDKWTEHSGEWDSSSGYLQGHGVISAPAEFEDQDIGAYGEWEFDFQFTDIDEGAGDQYQLLRFQFINEGTPESPTGYYVIVTGDVPGGSQANMWRIENGEPPDDAPLIAGMWSADTDVHTLGIERTPDNDFALYMDGEILGSTNDGSYTSSDHMGFDFDENPNPGDDHIVHEVRAQKILEDDEHNHLIWDASPDDPEEVSHYNIYRSESFGGTFEQIGDVEADGSSDYSYVDFYKGDADDIVWWYIVRAVGINGLEEDNENAIEEPGGEPGPVSPTDPIPEDGAVDVSTDVDLSVSVEHDEGDNMDVSFYDALDDSPIGSDDDVASGDRASVTWEGLDLDSTYEWYVIADDGEQTARSLTWSFTTVAEVSDVLPPTDPEPEDGAVDVGLNPELSVLVEHEDEENMDVSFYDASDDLIDTDNDVASGDRASVTWSGLDPATSYTWYAVAYDGEDTAESAQWSFTTTDVEAYFDVEIVGYDEEIYEGDELIVDYTVVNTGDVEDTQTIEFKVDGAVEDTEEVTLEVDQEYEDHFTWMAEEEGTYTISVASEDDEDEVTVSVLEELVQYELTVDAEEGGTTDPEPGTYSYPEEEEVTIEAIPDEGWSFVEWTGDETGTDTTIEIIMNDDKEVTAVFEEDVEYYELTVDVEGEGEVNIDPDQEEYEEGTEVELTASPNEGWTFVEWTGDHEGTDEEVNIIMDEDKEITAHFEELGEAYFEVEIISPQDGDEFEEGEEVVVEYEVRNTGGIAGEQDIEFIVNGVTVETETISLEPDESYQGEFTWEADEDGEIEFEVRSSDEGETDMVSFSVHAADDPADPDDTDDEDDDFPWWILILLLVVIGVILVIVLLMRRKDEEDEEIPPEYPQEEGFEEPSNAAVGAPVGQPTEEIESEEGSCESCGSELRYIEEYERWYCDDCQEYR